MTEIIAAVSNALSNIQKKNGGWAVLFFLLSAWVLWSSWNENEKTKLLGARMQHTIDSLRNELINVRIEAAQYKNIK